MVGSFTVSDLLGFASIGCWLGAQFPQVLENIRRQSCDGLALPFLANWLLGDISNLVGCILTHQLPFQTWLATYFVCVDCMLVAQYFYYYKSPKVPSHFPHVRPQTPSTLRRLSVDRASSRYRTLSAVAANVAAAAALAAQQEEQPSSTTTLRPFTYSTNEMYDGLPSTSRPADDEDGDEDALAALGDSYHSESGRSFGRKRVSWSIERHGRGSSGGQYPTLPGPITPTALQNIPIDHLNPDGHTLQRGRTAQRDTYVPQDEEAEAPASRRNSRASRRGSTMVFLGVWALFGIGTLANKNHGIPSSGVGRVLFPKAHGIPSAFSVPVPVAVKQTIASNTGVYEVAESEPLPSGFPSPQEHEPHPENPDPERVFGRIFAWSCTTLYLTSRLPQIWKNFVRKSVEGLSMYLFVFAFLGNTFYVASILLSPQAFLPPPKSTDFIRESIPYLLGSAGTLVFDITIVTQSFIYRPRPRRHASTHTRIVEEEAGLLSGDALSAHSPLNTGESAIMNRGRSSRTRSTG